MSERRCDSAPQERMGRQVHCPEYCGVTEAQQDKGARLGHTAVILEAPLRWPTWMERGETVDDTVPKLPLTSDERTGQSSISNALDSRVPL